MGFEQSNIIQDIFRITISDYLALIHHHSPSAQSPYQFQVVSGNDFGHRKLLQ
jgi:hypothetical protein